jgi:hypothetical protein
LRSARAHPGDRAGFSRIVRKVTEYLSDSNESPTTRA